MYSCIPCFVVDIFYCGEQVYKISALLLDTTKELKLPLPTHKKILVPTLLLLCSALTHTIEANGDKVDLRLLFTRVVER